MPLVSYDDVLPWARSIREQTLTRRMPKWHAARGYGSFVNDPTLTPYELSLITAWVDAGSPPGPEQTAPAAPARIHSGLAIDAGAATATIRTRSGWITGWDFTPGDPLITLVTFTSSNDAAIGTWVAGDRIVRLPRGSAIRVVPPVRVEIRRREKTAYEGAFTPLKSMLRLTWTPPSQQPQREVVRRVWTERVACGGALGPAESSVLAVRPLLESGAAAQITLERLGGAQPALLGWFRDFDPGYSRIYWLRQPLDFAAGGRVSGDARCQLEIMLSARRPIPNARR